ncbi:MAG: prephenate dehydratase [Pseudohongiellaceae bacterium]
MQPSDNVSVAYLGPRGTFSEAAARTQFGATSELHNVNNKQPGANDKQPDANGKQKTTETIKTLECSSIGDVFTAVEEDKVNYGVVPVENSTEGAVNNTLDCLLDSPLQIIGERIIKIEHHLFAQKGVSLTDIRLIASHQQSLAQCRKWLQAHYPQLPLHECTSNAEAALMSADNRETAAIAGELAGQTYGLHTVAKQIQDEAHNSTRFLILAKHPVTATGNDKSSLLIFARNRPGALFHILQPFENLQISLTRLESRPSRKEAWAYVFFLDFEGHRDDENVQELFRRLEHCNAEIKVLGSYPRA